MESGRARLFAVALALLFPLSTLAFRPRPLSDLRFGFDPPVSQPFVATDGTDFLTVRSSRELVIAQKLVRGNPAGPPNAIARGDARGIVWNGRWYLVAWSDARGLWIADMSREGSVLRMPSEPVLEGGRFFASNGKNALATRWDPDTRRLVSQPLDLLGRKAGPTATSEGFDDPGRLDAAGDRYVATGQGPDYFHVSPLYADGTHSPTFIVSYGGQPVAAGDGSNAAVFFVWADELHASMTDSLGRIGHGLHGPLGFRRPTLSLTAATWDGSQYLVLVAYTENQATKRKLVRVSTAGSVIGDPLDVEESAWALALLSGSRAAVTQEGVTIAAGKEGFLAAWSEPVDARTWRIRASRVDSAGNYLDGEGLALGTVTLTIPPPPGIAVATNGSDWIVVWCAREMQAVRISSGGAILDRSPLSLGTGDDLDVAWNGSRYLVVYTRSTLTSTGVRGLYATTVGADGSVAQPWPLIETPVVRPVPSTSITTSLFQPALVMTGGEGLIAFERSMVTCAGEAPPHCFGGLFFESSIDALRIGRDGAAIGGPFRIALATAAGPHQVSSRVAAATDGARSLVTWSQSNGLFGAFLPAGRQPSGSVLFRVTPPGARQPSLAFDGRDFAAAWESGDRITTARISTNGVVQRVTELQQPASRPFVAASSALPPLIAFRSPNPLDGVPRGALLFASELEPVAVPPAAPLILDADRRDDEVMVQWQPVYGALGIAVDVQLSDGTYREMGVAAGGATFARVPLLGLSAIGVRLRAWSSAGESEPSRTIPLPARQRAIR